MLAADDMSAEISFWTGGVTGGAYLARDIQHDRHREHVMGPGEFDELLPRFGLHVRGVHHGQPPGGQSLARDVVQHVECVTGRGLVVLVV